jgi:hypothetical protein
MDAEWSGRNRVDVTLTHDGAVVLGNFLRRWQQDGTLERLPFQDGAESMLLADLLRAVEAVVDETIFDSYAPAVNAARARVRNRIEDASSWTEERPRARSLRLV